MEDKLLRFSQDDLIKVGKEKDEYYNNLLEEKQKEIEKLEQMLVDVGKENQTLESKYEDVSNQYKMMVEHINNLDFGKEEKPKENSKPTLKDLIGF